MRRPAAKLKPRIAQTTRFAAPIAGWKANENPANPSAGPQGAIVLENIFPTATGAQIRRGSTYTPRLAGRSANHGAIHLQFREQQEVLRIDGNDGLRHHHDFLADQLSIGG
ncbi:hypothetical protein [Sinorhizobium psoraleae]|uniref:Uncharacterized protein n=1 Tax=Sinorhizobium psoraleae TaxID=520838 RepID=A0ABT4KBH5_9HYPH|nr:hypothetical protein [Sinorhizobium psoraleae]MCZ4089330.1 hypothetical protein [Sinorhizobium psoraleae]